LWFVGTGSDAETAAGSLTYRWDVFLHHNNHIHPTVWADNDSVLLIGDDHDDGTGVWLRGQLVVTDPGGLRDTAMVLVFPDNDLEPSDVTTVPTSPVETAAPAFRFELYNHGGIKTRRFHWALLADATTLAEGDTLVAARDSVQIVVTPASPLPAGDYDLRVVADSLGVVVEKDESNNARTRTLSVLPGPVSVAPRPGALSLSGAVPNPSPGRVTFALELPRAAAVEFAIFDVQGREVWRAAPGERDAGRHALAWNAETARGERAGAGLYFARVRAGGVTLLRRFAVTR
jgi:hypothetical protein